MVMQMAENILVGASNPGADNRAAVPPPASAHQDSSSRPENLRPDALPLGRGWM